MTAAVAYPGLSSTDRIGLTVFGSMLAHVVVVLGVTFALPRLSNPDEVLPNLEITLVQTRSEKQPDKANLLAQANQEGGGDSEKPLVAKSPLPAQEISRERPAPPPARKPAQPSVPPDTAPPPMLVKDTPTARVAPPPKAKPRERIEQPADVTPGILTDELFSERARLSAEISRSWEEYQKRPRRKFLSARTREYKYAAYMDAWRAKVERVGNLNYPHEAKRQGLTGSLVLDVALNPDGSINAIKVQRPSGMKVLDQAATRIVELAAPFAPFPPDFRKEIDILHITRTWQFSHGDRWQSE